MGRITIFATLSAGLLAFGGGAAFAAVVHGTPGADDLTGGNTPDTLLGGTGNDILDGGNGNDIISLSFGGATASGGSGDDTFRLGFGDNIVDGGDGIDTLVKDSNSTSFTISTPGAELSGRSRSPR